MRGAFSSVQVTAAVLLAMTVTWPIQVSAQRADGTCETFYRIKRGDTLRALTRRVYGHDRYSLLFGANRDILNDPAAIEAGQLLFIPCDGSGVQSRQEALQLARHVPTPEDQLGSKRAGVARRGRNTAEELPQLGDRGRRSTTLNTGTSQGTDTVAVVSPADTARIDGSPSTQRVDTIGALPPKLTLLSADGMEPLAGSQLPGGGLVGDLIREALREVAPSIEIETAFVNDRKAHLEVLLPLDAFTLSFPWPAPDCDPAGKQGVYSREICRRFEFSLPIYQTELRYFARRGDPVAVQASSLGDLQAFSICRPVGFPPVDLERDGIGARIVVGASVSACVDALAGGEVDVLSVPATMMTTAVAEQFVELEALRSQEPVHAIFARGSAGSSDVKAALDLGLREIQASGAWFRSVSAYLSDFNQNRLTATN